MIETVFNNHLDAMELSFNISIPGNNSVSRLEYLHKVTRDNSDLSQMMKSYGNFVQDKIKVSLNGFSYNDNLSSAIAEILFVRVLNGAVNIYSRGAAPKTHHWLPVVYMKSFGISMNPKRNRDKSRAVVDAVVFSHSDLVDVNVKDFTFAHSRSGDDGYYDLSVEAFFGGLESNYAHAKECMASSENYDALSAAYMASFFIVQSVRNPHPSMGFSSGEFNHVISQVMKNFDAMGEIYVNFGSSEKKLPFSPYVPDRVRREKLVNYFYMPITSHNALIISNRPVSSSVTNSLVSRFRDSVLSAAKRSGGMVFGLKSTEI